VASGRATPEAPVPKTAAHIPALDGVRGIAVMMVLLLHFTILTPATAAERVVAGAAGSGWLGVDLFFVLSGFLITGILLETRDRPGYFRNFFARRTLRIFPLYFAYIAAIFIVLPAFKASVASEPQAANRVWVWTYLANVLMARGGWEAMPSHTTHLWSLAVEEQFYLVWPLVVWALSPKRLAQACLAMIVGAVAVRLAFVLSWGAPAAYTMLPARMDTLALGALLALAVRRRADVLPRRPATTLAFAGAALLTPTVVAALRSGEGAFPPLFLPMQLAGYTGGALLAGALVLVAARGTAPSWLQGFLTNAALRRIGAYSYGMYVLHVPLRDLLRSQYGSAPLPRIAESQLPAQLLIYAIGIGVTFVVSAASWHLFEVHFIRLKDRFTSRRAEA
jgi:peptidoglycan/LPS O-acetylase OafA/YrhL